MATVEIRITVQVAFADPDLQWVTSAEVPQGSTLADVVAASGLQARFPSYDFQSMPKGVWGLPRPDDHVALDGDRVEIYRPLVTDAKQARRKRAQKTVE